MSPVRRIGCVHIPSFPIVVAAHAAAAAGDEALAAVPATDPSAPPLVLRVGAGHRARVQAANPAALRAGIRPGVHTVARACTHAAELRVLPWDDALLEQAHLTCTALLLEQTPAVTCAAPGRFWVDASGQERRGGELALATRLSAALREAGYPDVRAAIAGSVVAAEIAAVLPGPSATVVPPDPAPGPDAGVDAVFLAPLPLGHLPLPDDLREVLTLLGLQTIGELAALPAASLEVRFGAAGLVARARARGIDPRGPLCLGGPRIRLVEIPLDPPADALAPLVFGARMALVALQRARSADGARIARLRLHLQVEPPHAPVVQEVGLSRPAIRLAPLVDRCRAALETLRLPAPVTTLGVEVLERVSGARGEQGDLFEARFRDPEALEAALSRIRARCGTASVVRPVPLDSHRPEEIGRWLPDPATSPASLPTPPPAGPDVEAPTALLSARRVPALPTDIAVRAGPDPERPDAVHLSRRWEPLAACSPAYRRSGAWWQAAPWGRTDFRVLTRSGARLHVSREVDADDTRWTLLGWED